MAIFDISDKKRTILVPWFSDFYSPFVPLLGGLAGYKIKNLPPSDKESVNMGLDYANNEVCYPATLVVGDIIRALKSNEYNHTEIAIGITQTGGQCMATNYISLIKRALKNAGFANVPVIAIASSKGLYNTQPGFTPNWRKVVQSAFMALLFADCLSRMFYATICREKNEGASLTLKKKYLNIAIELLENGAYNKLLDLLKEAVLDFNAIQINVKNNDVQTVGIVGEIYVKYNAFGQFNIIDWLIKNKVEVVLPPLLEFFTQSFVNSKARKIENISQTKRINFMDNVIEWGANYYINKFEGILENFKYYRPVYNIKHAARLASDMLSLNNQYGEGWLIPAGIASLSIQNINNIICIQPFGCISNHIVGKGMENKIKSHYPDINLLFLDFDHGTSKINILNRLHFLLHKRNEVLC